ncbi:hypothetical protein K432DRAFT_292558 [Lepidopterella palustris CBS 459.81]|uniref:Uncharacterized protein n=1 Tax=Lepidopterella palustris CBS 459.81 TaxID=1314670 RepID=A0A8E2EFC1_9PEZI|nr:hypothetical protein K432DRAFT_292558 [Lepidopterella palustris CBS 459.81]
MAGILGKRKRVSREGAGQQNSASRPSESPEADDIQAIFQRHFEAKFKPLDLGLEKVEIKESAQERQDEEATDWEGISSEDEKVEIVEHSARRPAGARPGKDELKAFMSSKPPSFNTTISKATQSAPAVLDDDIEALNLKNDLALQRLLRESHLLDGSTSAAANTLAPSGANRQRALDMRLQTLGSKRSILTQKNMPMSHRKGIVAKATQREESRRKEAKENGIILEAATKMKKAERRRERGIGGPGVGKFNGGTLKLSRKDVESIQGSRSNASGGRGRR